REPMSALKRADSLIITRADQVPPQAIAKLDQTITNITGKAPIAHASHQWIGLLDTQDNEHDLQLLNGKPCSAAIAIGNPAAFGNTLQAHASDIKDMIIKPDHHAWPAEEVKAIVEQAKAQNAIVITTEKDYVKWPKLNADDPVYRVKLAMGFSDATEQDMLIEMVQGTLATDAHR
ncbi:MAG: tetraacyldisaccharide 4'-kinase, partial [Phycisphaeraceae bacterium JB051]